MIIETKFIVLGGDSMVPFGKYGGGEDGKGSCILFIMDLGQK